MVTFHVGSGDLGKALHPAKSRKRSKAHARQYQSAGRPKADRERYDNGRLKPPKPNAVVIAHRRAALGDANAKGRQLQPGENALDLMVARGWLEKPLRRAAARYLALIERAGPAFTGCILKVRTTEFERKIPGHVDAKVDEEAIEQLRAIWDELKPYPHRLDALNEVVTRDGWPAWLIHRVNNDGELDHRKEMRRLDLLAALRTVQRICPDPTPENASRHRFIGEMQAPPPIAGKVLEHLTYVDPDGELLFEVERRGRRVAA